MTYTEIADLLCESRRRRKAVKEMRVELISAVVNHCGVPQDEAKTMDVETFLDGYLTGIGMTPSWRDL